MWLFGGWCARLRPGRGGRLGAFFGGSVDLQDFLDFVVEDEHEGAAGASEDVREGSLEEGFWSLCFGDGGPAMDCVLVDDLALGAT